MGNFRGQKHIQTVIDVPTSLVLSNEIRRAVWKLTPRRKKQSEQHQDNVCFKFWLLDGQFMFRQ